MSAQALIWAANVRGLKPATKIVLIQLSERHNKDTGLCNPSIKTLAEDCEMDRTTVMRHLAVLESLGLLTAQATGKEDGGRSNNQYQLHMPIVEPTDVSKGVKSDFATGVKSQCDGGLSRIPTGVKSHSCATLTLREPKEEPSLFGSIEPQSNARDEKPDAVDWFSEFWAAYPIKKGKPAAEKAWAKAVKKHNPVLIIGAAKVYAQSKAVADGFGKFPQGWLNDERFNDPDLKPVERKFDIGSPEDIAERQRRQADKTAWMKIAGQR